MGYRVRFHLARGKNYMKWQIKENDGTVVYVDPQNTSLTLYNCKLRNRKNTAIKIREGANKTVCAWIECDSFIEKPNHIPNITHHKEVKYNPRVCPWWSCDQSLMDLDEEMFDEIVTIGNNTFAKNEK